MKLDYPRIWARVINDFHCATQLHDPEHWRRVELNGLLIAPHSGALVDVVRLFAVFHDSRRENDLKDDNHGPRAVEYAASLRGELFDLPDEQFDLLQYAICWHADGTTSDDPTIGTCWDADRLDLVRVGIQPDVKLMSTDYGRILAVQSSKTMIFIQ